MLKIRGRNLFYFEARRQNPNTNSLFQERPGTGGLGKIDEEIRGVERRPTGRIVHERVEDHLQGLMDVPWGEDLKQRFEKRSQNQMFSNQDSRKNVNKLRTSTN